MRSAETTRARSRCAAGARARSGAGSAAILIAGLLRAGERGGRQRARAAAPRRLPAAFAPRDFPKISQDVSGLQRGRNNRLVVCAAHWGRSGSGARVAQEQRLEFLMMIRGAHRRPFRAVDIAVLAALALAGSATMAAEPAAPPDSSSLSAVLISATPEVESAKTQAPTLQPLDVSQPTSVVSQYFIQNNIAPSGNFDDAIAIAPSVQSVSPNGPGLMENMVLSIRGFTNGEYNVTFDGIPWGDSNDFTQHSTSYYMGNDEGSVSVDRGPGTAATIGNATFGGTVSVDSARPRAQTTFTPYYSYGSWNTQDVGARFDTGSIAKYDGTAGYINAQSLSSDGYLSGEALKRKNVFTKFVAPLDGAGVVTFVAMYNQLHQNVGLGATREQIAQFGPSYQLSNDPTNQNYYGYNFDDIHSDFEYLGIAAPLAGGWSVDNKVYTYAYYHDGHNGEDPNGFTPNGTSYSATDVPGQHLVMYYRSWGDTLNLRDDLPFGDVKTGLWVDRQSNERALFEVDETLNQAINPSTPGDLLSAYDRLLSQTLLTVQPYAQLDWNILPNLTLSPGVRYDHFRRDVHSIVNVKTGLPQTYTDNFDSVLPSVLLHYAITDRWVAYAQVGKGYLAPNENYFDRQSPNATSTSPQQSWNYQAGTSWQSRRLSLSGDVYYIDFSNMINSRKEGTDTVFYNSGGVIYRGIEAEATSYLGGGFSAFANGSINSAKYAGSSLSGLWIPNAPQWTGALGAIYNLHGWYASVMEKWVGKTYSDNYTDANNIAHDLYPIGSYGITDLSLGYTVPADASFLANASIKLQVDNVLDKTSIDALAGYAATNDPNLDPNADPNGTPLWWTIPARSVFATVTVPF
jgi:iron complex outermembrane recepter protein